MGQYEHFSIQTDTRNLFKSCLSGYIGEVMRRGLLVLVLLLASTLVIPTSSAQTPGVELDCGGGQNNWVVDVSPSGSRTTTVVCTATNTNSVLPEEVDIAVSAGVLSFSAPGKITIPPSDSVEFDVSFQANLGQEPATHEFNVSATVTSIGSIPASQFGLTDEFDGTVTVLAYGELTVDLNSMTRNIDSGDVFEVPIEVSNNGNSAVSVDINLKNGQILTDAGFDIEPQHPPGFTSGFSVQPDETEIITFNLTADFFEVDQEFEVEFCGKIIAVEGSDIRPVEEKCDSFKIKVAAEPKDALGTVGGAIGMDEQTMMMVIVGGGGGLGLLLVMMVVLKVNKSRKRRAEMIAEMEDDEDFLELDDFEEEDDLDFDGL